MPLFDTSETQAGVVQIYDNTLLVDTAQWDVQNIPSTYRHLQVIAQVRTTEAVLLSAALLRLNNDSGVNYDVQSVHGRNATAAATDGQGDTAWAFVVPGSSVAVGVAASLLAVITNYAGLVFEKSAVWMSGFADEAATGGDASTRGLHWRNTSAINRLTFSATSGNFLTGSSLTIYGLN